MPILGEVDHRRKSLLCIVFNRKEMYEWEAKDKQVEKATRRAK